MTIKIINASHHPLPAYETKGAAGMDLRAFIAESISLKPMERKLISTGLFIEIPFGYEAQIRPRSGMAIKRGLTLVNSPGTIDSDYRGELCLPIINLSTEIQIINDGDRLAQMVITKHEIVEWRLAETLVDSERGGNGFGSSGIK